MFPIMPVTRDEGNFGVSGSGVSIGVLRFLKVYSQQYVLKTLTGVTAPMIPLWTINKYEPEPRDPLRFSLR